MTIVQIAPSIDVADHVRKFGYNPDLDASSAAEDVTPFGNGYFPTTVVAAADIDVVSSSVADDNDTPAGGGTGARTITIQGLDANYKLQSETIALNGAADVHPALDYLRIFRAWVVTAGTGLVNAGNITIDVGGANTMAYILASRGQTLQAVYTVPANYIGAYMVKWDASVLSKTAAFVNFAIETKAFGGAWLTKELTGVHSNGPFAYEFKFPNYYPAKTDIRVRGIDADGDNNLVSAGFELMLTGRRT